MFLTAAEMSSDLSVTLIAIAITLIVAFFTFHRFKVYHLFISIRDFYGFPQQSLKPGNDIEM